jgi:hypothetical protein
MEGSTLVAVIAAGLVVVVALVGLAYLSSVLKSVQEMREEQKKWVETELANFREDLERDLGQRVLKVRGETQSAVKALKSDLEKQHADARTDTQRSIHQLNHDVATLGARLSDLALLVAREDAAAPAAGATAGTPAAKPGAPAAAPKPAAGGG